MLTCAAACGQLEMVRLLLRANADIDLQVGAVFCVVFYRSCMMRFFVTSTTTVAVCGAVRLLGHVTSGRACVTLHVMRLFFMTAAV